MQGSRSALLDDFRTLQAHGHTGQRDAKIFGWGSLRLLRSDVLKLEALEISCVSKRYLGCRQKLASAVNDKIGIEPTSGAP
jgi:hypothetical protein